MGELEGSIIMKRIIYSLAFMLLATMPAAAQQANDTQNDVVTANPDQPLGDTAKAKIATKRKSPNGISDVVYNNYSPYTITYQSVDGQKNPITLSAKVYLPSSATDISRILLACHPTVTSNSEVPTGVSPVDGEIKRMCGEDGNWMVVCPDYCGYGHSSYRQHPYLIHDVTARNCIDAVMAAIKRMKSGEWRSYIQPSDGILPGTSSAGGFIYYELKDDYTTDIVGYSQGGATALACTKYLESDGCPEDTKKTVNLRHTCCGDGPYSLIATINQYMDWGKPQPNPDIEDDIYDQDLEYPCVLPLILAAAKDAYADGCMRTVEVKDYFNEDFLKATDIINLLNSKATSTTDINAKIKETWTGRLRPMDILSRNVVTEEGTFNTETNEYKCLMQAFRLADLTQGWVPTTPITFVHLHADKVVPYANYAAVEKGIKVDNDKVRFVDIELPHYIFGTQFMEFVAYWMKDLDGKPDYDTMSHATGGVMFYIHYLFGKGLRPETMNK